MQKLTGRAAQAETTLGDKVDRRSEVRSTNSGGNELLGRNCEEGIVKR